MRELKELDAKANAHKQRKPTITERLNQYQETQKTENQASMRSVTLTEEQAHKLYMYILMTTEYRKKEIEALTEGIQARIRLIRDEL